MSAKNGNTAASMPGAPGRISIVGGGIIGTVTAIALQREYPRARVTLISDRWSPSTTGDVSAGLIFPYCIGAKTARPLLDRLLRESFDFFARLAREPMAGEIGVSLITMYELVRRGDDTSRTNGHGYDDDGDDDDENRNNLQFREIAGIPDTRRMTSTEIVRLFPGGEFASGIVSTTFIAEPHLLLPYLIAKFREKGGEIVTRRITELSSLFPAADLVINCTGIGSRFLPDVADMTLDSVRGQVVRIRAPWIRHAVFVDDNYIIPNRDCVILGGTKELGDYRTEVDEEIAARIVERCARVIPSIRRAKKLSDGVGLRPYRPAIRIERDSSNARLIHNYGHGGSGVTLCWGSALEVIRLTRQMFATDRPHADLRLYAKL